MELTSKQVTHRKFGTGQIISIQNGHITIEFSGGMGRKIFCYPAAFDQHLEMGDPAAQEFVLEDLRKLEEKSATERAHKEQEILEAARLRAEAKKPVRRTAARTTRARKAAAPAPVES